MCKMNITFLGDELLHRSSDGNVYKFNVDTEVQEVYIPSEIFVSVFFHLLENDIILYAV